MDNKLNHGAMFRNEKKKDTHPDYRGGINVSGVEKELAGWIKTDSKGKKYLSLTVSDPYKKPTDKYEPPAAMVDQPEPENDGLPF